VQSLGFSYDTANRIIHIANGINSNLTQTIGYDSLSRMTSVSSGADNESYQYDADGNRLNGVVNGAAQTYIYASNSNQLTSFSSGLSATYGYDAKGNTSIVNGTTSYLYNPFNRLSSAGGATNYINPEGQRLRKTGGSTGTTYFAPDASGALMAEYNGAWVDYVRLNGRLIGRMSGGQAYAIHVDQVGRPEEVTDSSRAVVWRAQNYPFNQNVTLANITLNLGFPGQYYDAETWLWHNGYRDYSSGFGRYLESDPIGLAGGINTYAYVGNNPLSYVDRSGLFPNPAELTCVDPVQPVCWAGVAVDIGATALVVSEVFAPKKPLIQWAKPKPGSKPKNCPAGTLPIDQYPGLSKDDVHDIKDAVGAGPRDWTGIDRDGNVITGDPLTGDAVPNGPYGPMVNHN
jgi:RHS repeat-associated protein